MTTNKNDYIDSFLHTLKIVIKEGLNYIPEDPRVYRVNKRIMLAIQMDPLFTFNKVGSYLYKYRDFIYDSSSEELLLKWEFIEVYNETDKEVQDVSLLVISEFKRCILSMNQEQKSYYRKMISSLLDDYIEYTCPE